MQRRHGLATIVAAVLSLAPLATAGPPDADALLGQLSEQCRLAARTDLPADQRQAAAEHALDIRSQLIKLAPDDVRAPTWMVDQAAATLALNDGDGANPSILFGIPTPEQTARVGRSAEAALQLLEQAADAAKGAVARLDNQQFKPSTDDKAAARIEEDMSRLIDTEQAARIPYYTGVCNTLLAACATDAGQRVRRAHAAATALNSAKLKPGWATAARDAYLGAALRCAGNDPALTTRAREVFVKAYKESLSAGDSKKSADPLIAAQIRFGMLATGGLDPDRRDTSADTLRAGAKKLLDALDTAAPDPLIALLTAEAVARDMLAVNRTDPDWLDAALTPLADTPRRAMSDAQRAAMRSLVRTKIALATDASMPYAKMASPVVLARAATLADRADPEAHTAARRLLELIVNRPAPAPADPADASQRKATRTEAAWRLAVILSKSDAPADLVRAVELLNGIVENDPTSDAASRSLAKAPQLGRFALHAALDTPAHAAALDAYRDALEHAVASPGPSAKADAWRIELAEVLLRDPDGAGDAVHLAGRIMDLVETVDSDKSLNRRAEDAVLAAVRRAADEAASRAGGGDKALVPLAERAVLWADGRRSPDADALRLLLARVLVDRREARALVVLGPLVRSADPAVDPVQLQLTLGRAQRLAGDDKSAFATLRSLAESLDHPGPDGAPRPDAFWHAWADMLQILAARNTDGARTGEIRLNINRLCLIDPNLGPATDAARIRAVRDGLDRR